mgnify:CR=1 FL=1
MLNVGRIEEGFVLDHIKAGKSMSIYKHLGLDKLDCTVAIIKNARSDKMGKKDILKVECDINTLNLDILGFLDHNITVNVVKNCEIVQKLQQILLDDAAAVVHGYYNSSMISRNATVGGAAIHTADYYWITTDMYPVSGQ